MSKNKRKLYFIFLESMKQNFETHFNNDKELIATGLKGDNYNYIANIRVQSSPDDLGFLVDFVYFDSLINILDCKRSFAEMLIQKLKNAEKSLMEKYSLVKPHYSQGEQINTDQVVEQIVRFYTKLNQMLRTALRLIPIYSKKIDKLMDDFVDEVLESVNSPLSMSITEQIFKHYQNKK